MRREFCRRSWLLGLALGLSGKSLRVLGGKKEPVAWLYRTRAASQVTYNGVAYPVIEARWNNKETYPYAFIYRYSGTLATSAYLILCQTAPYYDSTKNAVCVEGQYSCYGYTGGTYWRETTDDDGEFPITTVWGVHWSSDSILYKDSTDIYLAGSEPPVVTFPDAAYFVDGIGYKDMVLPKLPVWDKEKYPNAVMSFYDLSDEQRVVLNFLANLTTGETTVAETSPYFVRYDSGDMEYRSVRADSTKDFPAFSEGTVLTDSKTFGFDYIIWSGTDLYEPDGKLYIHGSSPIPIYE